MLNLDRPSPSGSARGARRRRVLRTIWPVLFLVPFVATACISVTDVGEEATPSPGASAPLAGTSPTPVPLATPTPRPTPEPTPEPVEAEVVGFLPNWLLADAAALMDTELLTLVAFHGIEASGDGRLVSEKPGGGVPSGWKVLESDEFTALQASLQAEGVKVVPTIQRFGWADGTAERTEALLGRKKVRRALATRIAEFVDERGFDGVNLDFEPVPADLTNQFVFFVRELRLALDDLELDRELHLSVDVLPGLAGYDLAALTAEDAADLAIILGYNYRTDAAATAGSHAPLYDGDGNDLATTVAEALELTDPDKLVLALPWYGKVWSTETDAPGSATMRGRGIDGAAEQPYSVAVELAAQGGRRYDAEQATAWTAYPDKQCATCPAVWRQVWYDDPDGFGAKVDYALEQGLAGVGIWALGQEGERPELWWTLRDRLRPRNDTSPPNGSAAIDPEAVRGDLEGLDVVEGSAPLRLFASDDANGSGLALARIGLDPEVGEDGRLVTARTYPPLERIDFALGDEATGGSSEDGPRSIHVQWRDLAGNWSAPLVIEASVVDPARTSTPADL